MSQEQASYSAEGLKGEQRLEHRFQLDPSELDLLLPLLDETQFEESFSPQEVHTVYFATDQFETPPGITLRRRTYGNNGISYLEIKCETEGRNYKYRLDETDRPIDAPVEFNKLEEVVRITGNEALLAQLQTVTRRGEGDGKFLPILSTKSQRMYFYEGDTRITIDFDEEVDGYFGEDRDELMQLHKSSDIRLEIKATADELATRTARNLAKHGIKLEPYVSRREHLRVMYLEMRTELRKAAREKGNTNEAPGQEIELKLQIDSELLEPFTILGQLQEKIKSEPNSPFGTEGDVKQEEWECIAYGVRNGSDGLDEAFVVMSLPLANAYGIKTKPPRNPSANGVYIRPEYRERHIGAFDTDAAKRATRNFSDNFEQEPELVGRFSKKMQFVTLTNRETDRSYKVNVDTVTSDTASMSQLEIEYKHKKGISDVDKDQAIEEITAEMLVIRDYILQMFEGKLEPTTLAKFDWLVSN